MCELSRAPRANIAVVSTLANPLGVSSNCVWTPGSVEMRENTVMITAVACAATGLGGTLTTNLLAIDCENRPGLIEADGSGQARGCIDALRLIGGQYSQSGFATTSPLAFTRGIHRSNSVVGQTDEGSLTRTLSRTGTYVTRYGEIF